MSRLANMPGSMWWFVATGIIYLLQLIPFTGIFLMMLAAPFWSVVTINLGFVSLAGEALFGRISRVWLLAPLLWFGGYGLAAHLSHQMFHALDTEARAANAGKRFRFSPEAEALVIDAKSRALSGAAQQFARGYDIPAVYETNTNYKTAAHLAHRIGAEPVCTAVRNDKAYSAAGVHSFGIHETREVGSRPRKLVKGLCAIHAPEDPVLPKVTVDSTTTKRGGFLLPHELTHVRIRSAASGELTLVAGQAAPLAWLPRPIIGCALNSGAPSWDCFMGFGRERAQGLGGEGAYGRAVVAVLTEALSLRPSPPSERREKIDARPLPGLQRAVADRTRLSLETLDAVIADPTRRITVHDIPGLREKPELIGSRTSELVTAIGRALDNGRSTYETARVLQGPLAALPEEEFRSLGGTLLDMFGNRAKVPEDMVEMNLAARLGNLGPEALPLLERLIFDEPARPNIPAIYGACRVGAAASTLAERLRNLVAAPRRRDELVTAVYVALRRFGRDDLIDVEAGPESPFGRVRKKVIQRAIGPASPPGVCANDSGWPRLPDVQL